MVGITSGTCIHRPLVRSHFGRASFVFSLQTWLAEGPDSASKGTPGILSIGMARMHPFGVTRCWRLHTTMPG